MSILATAFYENANYGEAVLWMVMGALLVGKAVIQNIPGRVYYFLAAGVFVIFGLSDVAEARLDTDTWWDPWWLGLWKVACVAALAPFVVGYFVAGQKKAKEKGETPK